MRQSREKQHDWKLHYASSLRRHLGSRNGTHGLGPNERLRSRHRRYSESGDSDDRSGVYVPPRQNDADEVGDESARGISESEVGNVDTEERDAREVPYGHNAGDDGRVE